MTLTYDTAAAHVTAARYAEISGVSERTVKRWLADDELPGAYQDERGRWMIPADAARTPKPADIVQLDRPMSGRAAHPSQGELALSVAQALDAALDTLPSFLALDVAASVLGISRHAIATHRDYFDVVPFGPNGSLVVPLATIKRIRG